MIQIFIVFHKAIYDECYKHIPSDVLEKYFTFFAVNENIEKIYDKKYKVIREWELPIYDPTFQERGYNENSAIYHVYANQLHKNYSYVGFAQYDMLFQNNIIEWIQTMPRSIFILDAFPLSFCEATWNEPITEDRVIKDYEKIHGSFSKDSLYPLFNTYVLPVEEYESIMKWVVTLYDKLYPWCVSYPNHTHFGHIGGIYERIMAFAIGQSKYTMIHMPMKHDHYYKKLSY